MDAEKSNTAHDAVERARAAFEAFPEHWQIASQAIAAVSADDRVLGLYLSGSFAKGEPDRWSDIDLYVVVTDGQADEVVSDHKELICEVADVATSFPATHLGDPRHSIVFYRAREPIHIDYQYRELGALKPSAKDRGVLILLDRTDELERWQEACRQERAPASPTREELQYVEDRFWGWCWYTHSKIERGELWEAREAVEYIRSNVLLALAHSEGQPFEGNRRLEAKLPQATQKLLAETLPVSHDAIGYSQALKRIIDAYSRLFDALPADDRDGVKLVDRAYFTDAIRKSS